MVFTTFGKKTSMLFKIILVISLSFSSFLLSAQEDYFTNQILRYDNFIYKESIKTPLTFRQSFELSYPFVELNATDTIAITFDEIADNIGNYSYTLIHCNSNWQPSQLSVNDYIDGFSDNPVTEYKQSFNTFCNYIHYKISFPNENVKLKASGNYLLIVFEDGDKEKLVLSRRFFVVESKTEIEASIKRATQIDLMKSHQEVDFTIRNGFTCNDPFQDIKVVVSQNYRWDNAITDLKPLFVKDNELIYNYEDGNIFQGGSEFRWIDAKSVRYQTERVQYINFEKPYYHFYLLPDEKRTFKIYFQWQDLNGKFLVKNSLGIESDIEADYVYTTFTLPYEAPMVDGNMYVFGALSDWRCSKSNMMIYNYEKKAYQLTMFLKQGFYDYQYAYMKDGSKEADLGFIEGNHYETENDYLIFVYWHDMTSKYDRLTGLKVINSVTQK